MSTRISTVTDVQVLLDAFVLDGVTADRTELFRALDGILRGADANWALVLVFCLPTGIRLLHSATLFSHKDSAIEATVREDVHDLFLHASESNHAALLATLETGGPDRKVITRTVANALLSKVVARTRTINARVISLGEALEEFKVAIVLGGRSASDSDVVDGIGLIGRMLAISRPVQAYSASLVTESFDRELSIRETGRLRVESQGRLDSAGYETAFEQDLLEVCKDLTDSEAVAIYDRIDMPDETLLVLSRHTATFAGPDCYAISRGESSTPDFDSERRRPSPPVAALSRSRPLLANTEADYLDLDLDYSRDDSGPVLVVPVPNSLGPTSLECSALLVCETDRNRQYTVKRLQAARVAADRLSQFRSSQLFFKSADLTSEVLLNPLELRPESEFFVPSEWMAAQPVLQQIVSETQRLFTCMAVSLRLLTTDLRHLVRVAASPFARLGDPGQGLDTHILEVAPLPPVSVVAHVCHTGEPYAVSDVHEFIKRPPDPRIAFFSARRGVGSEYCVPIRIGPRVVGTLNFEKRSPGISNSAYRAATARIADICGEHLNQRMMTEHLQAQQLAFGTAVVVHALGKSLRAMEEQVTALQDAVTDDLADSVRAARGAVGEFFPSRPGSPQKRYPRTVQGLISTCSKRAHYLRERLRLDTHDGVIDSTRTALGRRLDRNISAAAGAPIDEVLLNAAEAARSVPGEITIRASMQSWAGREYAAVLITNPMPGPPPLEVRDRLFRLPLKGRSYNRGWGAFFAAEQIRSVGGDVFVSEVTEREMTVCILIPVKA